MVIFSAILSTFTFKLILPIFLFLGTLFYCIPIRKLNQEITNNTLSFQLRHVLHNDPGNFKAKWDIPHDELAIWDVNGIDTEFELKSQHSFIKRLSMRDDTSAIESLIYHSIENPQVSIEGSLDWKLDDVIVPNITDPHTILQFAKMASNAYAKLPSDPSWRDINNTNSQLPGFDPDNRDYFNWDQGGVRGHVFVQQQTSSVPIVVIAIKGTTAGGLGGGNGDEETGDDKKSVERDKVNDNLLFSCCCGRVSSLWKTVCDCYESTYTCDLNCLERNLRQPDKYYKAVLDIYRDIMKAYPDSQVWVTGHSLGGALSSLLGRTYGLPVVTFESPGEMLASKRLHLPYPPGFSEEHIWHFGNNADPIFMGVCNGASSSCSIAGYAMESICHSGMKCTYDTVTELGWHVNMLNHRLKTVIDDLLAKTNQTAECIKPPPCLDCYDWTFKDHRGDRNSKIYLPSSSSSALPTPSEPPHKKKCLKYTWYGACYKWEGDDDDDEGGDNKGKTVTAIPTSTTTKAQTTSQPCLGKNRWGFCTKY